MWLPACTLPASLGRDDWTRHLLARLCASVLIAASLPALPHVLPVIQAWTDAGCLMQRLAGLPCPGCGITTSLLALMHGDIGRAWQANPAGAGIALLLAGQAAVATVWLRSRARPGRGPTWLQQLDLLAIGGLLVVWIGRLMQAAW